MNGWTAGSLIAGLVAAGLSLIPAPSRQTTDPARPWVLVITGNTNGYLSPCGCTSPMTGGIRRMASVVRHLEAKANVALIYSGGLAGLPGPQSDFKSETMAEALADLDVAAINFTPRDLALGANALAAVKTQVSGKLLASDFSPILTTISVPYIEKGPFVIGGASDPASGQSVSQDSVDVAGRLVATGHERGEISILMLDGSRDEAARLAQRVPMLGAIVYRRGGWPPDVAEKIGNVALLTPGEQGKAVVRIEVDGSRLVNYAVTRLGPEIPDDLNVSRFYRTYLRRVDGAGLLELLPRSASLAFAGSAACARCHVRDDHIWSHSAHAHAYADLAAQGHGRDPDCVSCHVVGLAYAGGFRSRVATPNLAAVGCESCHGPGASHVAASGRVKLGRVAQKLCESCHTEEQSPQFAFRGYWAKIAH